MRNKVIKRILCKYRRVHGSIFLKGYHYLYNCKYTQNIALALMRKTPRFYSNILFEIAFAKKINWKNPVWLDEKLNVLKCGCYYNNEKVIQCADKFRVREYILEKGGNNILTRIYSHADSIKDMNIQDLPTQFVVKRNNDAGGVLVVEDKNIMSDWKNRMYNLEKTTTRIYGLEFGEYHYQYIRPHYFIEEYIGKADGSYPYDYKFYCMNGIPRAALVCIGRENEESMIRFLVDMRFHILNYMQGEKKLTDQEIQQFKPESWNELIKTATRLSEEFPFVRVDLYDFDGSVLFGEMTFTPMGCRNYYFSEEGQIQMGKWLDIKKFMLTKR